MRIEVLGGFGGESRSCRTTCLLINGSIALDAGSLARGLEVEQQRQVRTVVLTHSHVDHTGSLPSFIDNVFGRGDAAVDIHASEATIYSVRRNIFNNSYWPDFTRLPNPLQPKLKFLPFDDEVSFTVGDVKFTPIAVDHVVPTHGFLIEQAGRAVLWSSDTGPTVRLWEMAEQTPHLSAVFLETSFDNSLQEIADVSMHLTPRTLETELAKLGGREIPVILHHLKPPCVDRILAEVEAIEHPDLNVIRQGHTYEF